MADNDDVRTSAGPAANHPGEVFAAFLKLGLTSFGGPIAHLGYFRDELVTRRRWISDSDYAELVALCQFLPGPASSQVGFGLGLMRAGWLGALAAFTAFTLPSALLLLVFALTAAAIPEPFGTGALDGLKIVAVAIVAQAVWGMAKNLCPDRRRASIAVGAVAVLAFIPGLSGMIVSVVAGAIAGLVLCRYAEKPKSGHMPMPVRQWQGLLSLAVFATLLAVLPLISDLSQALAVADAFYRSGALVFGGGHVVLPLLQAETVAPGWVTADTFLAGYGAAQAIPGPLFTFAAYLGAVLGPEPNGMIGAAVALGAIFLPGFLILIGTLPFWGVFRTLSPAQSLMQGANAAVVGILGAALYSPLFTSAIGDIQDFALALACFVLLTRWKFPPWSVVVVAGVGGAVLAL